VVNPNYLNGAMALTFSYSNANRLVLVQSGGVTLATYAVSALGQRVSKSVSGGTTLFIYDEQGHLIGEYDGTGALIQETIWLEDLPVATLRPTGAGGSPTPINVYYVHADHLGSPRAVTRPSDNAIMWQWDNLDPYGVNAANENPASQGTFHYNLRFPGQYYDAETGTHYNYYRDYDPAAGRYEQSDPIGLAGGMNTFDYGAGDPVGTSDPMGLRTDVTIDPVPPPRWITGLPWWWPGSPANQAYTHAVFKVIDAIVEACTPDPCEKAKSGARGKYNELVNKRLPQYLSGGTRGSDFNHYQAILQAQASLRDYIRQVRLHCKALPEELPEWERVASQPIPILF